MKPASNLVLLMTIYVIIAMAKAAPLVEPSPNALVQRDGSDDGTIPSAPDPHSNSCDFMILTILT